jgi:hypothetical protein
MARTVYPGLNFRSQNSFSTNGLLRPRRGVVTLQNIKVAPPAATFVVTDMAHRLVKLSFRSGPFPAQCFFT